jgi:antirestriction protein ArdC
MSTKVYEIITGRIVALLEAGTCPWRRPWATMPLAPQNFATGAQYRGINMLLLSSLGLEVPLFVTFRQVAMRGGRVREGSRGFTVVYWNTFEGDEAGADGDGKRRKIPFLRYYTVFAASQVEGLPFPAVPSRAAREFAPMRDAEAIVAGWARGPRIAHGFTHAAYVPAGDRIEMPSPGSFDSPEAYYATLFHEMGHATGSARRLARPQSGRFGEEAYSREELVAEMTAAFLCARCGIDNSAMPQQAAYLAGWIKALKGDPRLVVSAASQAQRAADLILGARPEAEEAE